MEILLPVLIGCASSLLTLVLIIYLRPKILISPQIAEMTHNGESKFVIKILNKGMRAAFDFKYELLMVRKMVVQNGYVTQVKRVDLDRDGTFSLAKFSKKNDEEDYADRIQIKHNLREIWEDDTSQYLIFRVIAKDQNSGLSKVSEMKFWTVRNSICYGDFVKGETLEIA